MQIFRSPFLMRLLQDLFLIVANDDDLWSDESAESLLKIEISVKLDE